MKTFPRLLILVFALITACSDDDKEATLSSRELLVKYDWIVFSVEREMVEMPEPAEVYVVLNFSETSCSGSDFTGEFFTLGKWTLEDDILTLDEETSRILELTTKKFVYEAPDGSIITRLPITEATGI